jgi:nicotinamide phosphoribosyltransferase
VRPILPVLLKDFYKVGHPAQYPKDTTLVYSNFTPRGTRRTSSRGVIAFGFQYLVREYFIDQFRENFFDRPKDEVLKAYKRRVDNALGPGTDITHIADLHELGYLPLVVKALAEGTLVPYRVPVLTIRNTKPEFFWLTNMVETLLSLVLWKPMTSATTAFYMRRVFEKYAKLTGADPAFCKWQGHDFSMRGMSGVEDACLSGAGHLLSYTGTDTIPAIDFLEMYYGADSDKELVGGSVPATEHSVMCMGMKDGEYETFKRLVTEVYPGGFVSVVSDTWDFWKVLTDYLPRLRESIMGRAGKVVIRPDSGDPVRIICGDPLSAVQAEQKGAIRLLYEVFGGTKNASGYIELDPHVGLIYGDSISPERQIAILEGLKANGFASSNVVLGVGSYTYEYVTRDTDGWAMKATYGETLSGGPQDIYKDPLTDDGLKKSAKGLLAVESVDLDGHLAVLEGQNWGQEGCGLLENIFLNGRACNFQTLAEIRARIERQL